MNESIKLELEVLFNGASALGSGIGSTDGSLSGVPADNGASGFGSGIGSMSFSGLCEPVEHPPAANRYEPLNAKNYSSKEREP